MTQNCVFLYGAILNSDVIKTKVSCQVLPRPTWHWRCAGNNNNWICVSVCTGPLPDGCLGYGAIEQRAQPPVQSPHPMAVHRLLHTVNWKRQRGQLYEFLHRYQEATVLLQGRANCSVDSDFLAAATALHWKVSMGNKQSTCQSSQRSHPTDDNNSLSKYLFVYLFTLALCTPVESKRWAS